MATLSFKIDVPSDVTRYESLSEAFDTLGTVESMVFIDLDADMVYEYDEYGQLRYDDFIIEVE